MDLHMMIKLYLSIFMICSPCSAIPAFLSLTQGRSAVQRRHVAIVASVAVACILVGVAWTGDAVIRFFGIRLATFQVAGGIILFLLAISMLHGETSKMKPTPEEIEERKKESVEIVPLAIPLMAGPGAISTVIVAAGNYSSLMDLVSFSICLLLVAFTLWLCLDFANSLEKRLGKTVLKLINRIGGLIIAVIAVDIIAKGVSDLFPGLL